MKNLNVVYFTASKTLRSRRQKLVKGPNNSWLKMAEGTKIALLLSNPLVAPTQL